MEVATTTPPFLFIFFITMAFWELTLVYGGNFENFVVKNARAAHVNHFSLKKMEMAKTECLD